MNKSVLYVVFACFMLVSFNSNAGSIRCGNKSFSSTDRKPVAQSAVLKACGEPTERRGEVWIYKKKGKQLKFVEGMLADIIDIKK